MTSPAAAFANETPYAGVQVELEEGPRLTANLVDLPPGRCGSAWR